VTVSWRNVRLGRAENGRQGTEDGILHCNQFCRRWKIWD